jgi:hypothetical protein
VCLLILIASDTLKPIHDFICLLFYLILLLDPVLYSECGPCRKYNADLYSKHRLKLLLCVSVCTVCLKIFKLRYIYSIILKEIFSEKKIFVSIPRCKLSLYYLHLKCMCSCLAKNKKINFSAHLLLFFASFFLSKT